LRAPPQEVQREPQRLLPGTPRLLRPARNHRHDHPVRHHPRHPPPRIPPQARPPPMTWATPLLAGLVAAIAIPALVILYFLKLRRTPREVSTTLLWKQTIQDIQANAPFQKLRKNILLFLQLIILALILLALAQPRSTSTSIAGQRI